MRDCFRSSASVQGLYRSLRAWLGFRDGSAMKNQLKTILLLGVLSSLLVAAGAAIGPGYAYGAFGLALLLNVGAYFFSDRIVLAMSRARAVAPHEAPELYRMVQEGLTNISKYAKASEATIVLQNFGGHVQVEVADNGQGFDTRHMRPATHGLAGMRHRVEAAQGKLIISSTPSKGTVLRAVLPAGVLPESAPVPASRPSPTVASPGG